MNFVAKNIQTIGLLLLTGLAAVVAVLNLDVPVHLSNPKSAATTGHYSCPMHSDAFASSPGDCPKCGMSLTPTTTMTDTKPKTCQHRASNTSAESVSGHNGCDHGEEADAGGCCSKKLQPVSGGCTRHLARQGESSTP